MIFHDQLILQYWDNQKNRWMLADMRMTEGHLNQVKIKLDFNFFDLPEDKYISSAKVWLITRNNPELQNKYGGGIKRGQWYIRDRLLQDLAALNKVEMLIW